VWGEERKRGKEKKKEYMYMKEEREERGEKRWGKRGRGKEEKGEEDWREGWMVERRRGEEMRSERHNKR
jgi:hypothetical protein